jgi:hypothetical protein
MLVAERRRRWYQRKRLIVPAFLLLLASVWFGRDPLVRRYEQHRAHQAIERARGYIAQGDLPNAMISVRIAAQSDLFNLAACRLGADILELSNSREAVTAREQILQVAPDSVSDRLACVRTAVRFGELRTAEHAFAGLSTTEQATTEGLRTVALLRSAQHRSTEAQAALATLVARDGNDAAARADLAALDLRSNDPMLRIQARAQLRALAAKAEPRAHEAIRELLRDAMARKNAAEAKQYAEQLVRSPQATFDDSIRLLNVHRAWPGLGSWRVSTEIQSRAARDPATATQFATWLQLIGAPADAAAWIEALPPTIREDQSVRAALASALAASNQWQLFARELALGAWGPIDQQTVQWAMAARTLRLQQRTEAATATWNRVVTANALKRDPLLVLVRLAGLWSWGKEYTLTLRALAEAAPEDVWPLQRLTLYYYQNKDTMGLRDTWALWVKLHPNDDRARADWVLASLLCSPDAPAPAVAADARKLYERDPHDPFAVTAYAVVRWRQDDVRGALKIFEQLSAEERTRNGRGLYYGAMLADAGNTPKAAEFLALAVEPRLLPEEARWLKQARLAIAGKADTVTAAP